MFPDARISLRITGVGHESRFRQQIESAWQSLSLHLISVGDHGEQVDPIIGRSTKQLYSVVGLLFLQDMNDSIYAETVEAYLFRTDMQYALNMEPGIDGMCERTLKRHGALFSDDET